MQRLNIDDVLARFDRLRSVPVLAYGLACCAFTVALLARVAVDGLLPPGFPFLTFFPAVVVVAIVCGTAPGLLTAGLSGLAAWYFFLPPFWSLQLSAASAVALGFFATIVGVDLLIIDQLMAALRLVRAERAEAVRIAEERDTLFREVQHRIGNNLQAISSMLLLQSRTVADPAARKALTDSMQRVAVVADIQRLFHDPDRSEGRIDSRYVEEIAEGCIRAAGLEDSFAVVAEVEPVTLPQDAFLSASLVLTECVNNTLEHGRRADRQGRIAISVNVVEDGRTVEVCVADDGPGPKRDFVAAESNSIGMKVIHAFTRQLGGRFDMAGGPERGTMCRLAFPLPDFGRPSP